MSKKKYEIPKLEVHGNLKKITKKITGDDDALGNNSF